MKAHASDELVRKTQVLSPSGKRALGGLLAFIERSNFEETIAGKNTIPLSGGIYVISNDAVKLFFSAEKSEKQEDYLLLLDVVEVRPTATSGPFYSSRDPRTNSSINPRFNSSINPKFNSSINPKFNSSINPKFNSSINPKFNSSINPKFNSSINPKFNSSINPKFNSSINPKFNSSINPKFNRAYGGPFVYDLELNQIGFLVRSGSSINLVFDPNGSLDSYTVEAGKAGQQNVFDSSGEWIGFWIRANDDIFLRFSVDGDWLGIVV